MKQVRALLMLGPFLILGITAIALIGVAVASVFVVNDYFDDVYTLVERRNQYQRVESSLLQLQVITRQTVMIALYGEPEEVDALVTIKEDSLNTINEAVDELNLLVYEDIDLEPITRIEQNRDSLTANFDATRDIASDEPTEDEQADYEQAMYELLDTFLDTELETNDWQRDLITDTEIELDQAIQDMEFFKSFLVWVVLGVMMVFPLLAVVGFLLASRFTQPLLQIDNSVMAVGGNHYRSALMEDTLRRRDSLGRLAKSVDSMANALKARDAALEKEVDDLRERLQEIRRRKLSTAVDIPVSELIGGGHVQ